MGDSVDNVSYTLLGFGICRIRSANKIGDIKFGRQGSRSDCSTIEDGEFHKENPRGDQFMALCRSRDTSFYYYAI